MELTFVVVTALLAVITFGLKEVLKEKVKDVGVAVASAESSYRTEQGWALVSLQTMLNVENEQHNSIKQVQTTSLEKNEVDYSDIIRTDSTQLQNLLGDLNTSVEGTSRLLDALPGSGRELRTQLDRIKPAVDEINQHALQTLRPSPDHGWTRAADLKLMIARVGIAELPVLALGDAALTLATKTRDAADRLYWILQWTIYILFAIGIALTSYAALTGAKVVGGGN